MAKLRWRSMLSMAQYQSIPTSLKLNHVGLAIGILYLCCVCIEATATNEALHLERISFGQHKYASVLEDEVLTIECVQMRLPSAHASAHARQLRRLQDWSGATTPGAVKVSFPLAGWLGVVPFSLALLRSPATDQRMLLARVHVYARPCACLTAPYQPRTPLDPP